MSDGSIWWRPCASSRYRWNPRLRDSSRVCHWSSVPPPGIVCALNDVKSTAVGDWIVEMAVEELFVRFGSLVVALTVAVLEEVVAELNVAASTLIVMITKPPTLTDPRLQFTVVVEAV